MTALTDYAKILLARALVARQPALPTGVWVGLGTGGTDAAGLTGEPAAATGYARQPATFTGSGVQRNAAPLRFGFTAAVGMLTGTRQKRCTPSRWKSGCSFTSMKM